MDDLTRVGGGRVHRGAVVCVGEASASSDPQKPPTPIPVGGQAETPIRGGALRRAAGHDRVRGRLAPAREAARHIQSSYLR